MLALVLPFLAEIFKWILGAVLTQAAKPSTAEILSPTPPDLSQRDSQLKAIHDFAGIPKMLMMLAACLLLGGCWGSRVIVLRPAVPMILAKDIKGADVYVKQDDGTYVEGTADLFAGLNVLASPDDFPIGRILKAQEFKVVNAPAGK